MESKRKRIASQPEPDLAGPVSQEDFGKIIGLTQQEVSRLCQHFVLAPGAIGHTWLIQYHAFMRGQIYAKGGWQALEP